MSFVKYGRKILNFSYNENEDSRTDGTQQCHKGQLEKDEIVNEMVTKLLIAKIRHRLVGLLP